MFIRVSAFCRTFSCRKYLGLSQEPGNLVTLRLKPAVYIYSECTDASTDAYTCKRAETIPLLVDI